MANGLIELLVEIKDNATQGFDRLIHKVVELTGVTQLLHGVLLAVTAGTVVGAIETLVNAFAEGELAVTRLNAALRVSGQYTEAGSKEIQEMAERMQHLTTTSSTAAIQISATIGAIAKNLTTGQLAELQKSAIALHDAYGVSVERATMMIARSLTGQSNMLRRWGIDLDTSAGAQERANIIISKTAGLFDISTAAAQTLSGRIAQMHNEWHQLQEVLGEVIVRFIGLDEKTTTVRDKIRELTATVKENAGEWIRYATAVVDALRFIGAMINAWVEQDVQTIALLVNTVIALFKGMFYGIKLVIESMWDGINFAIRKGINEAIIVPLNEMLELADAVAKKLGKRVELRIGEINTKGYFHETEADWRKLSGIVTGVLDDWRTRVALVKEAYQEVGDKWRTIAHDMDKPVVALKGFGDAGGGSNIGTPDDDPSESARRLLREHQLLEAQFHAGTIGLDEYNAGIKKITESIKQLLTNTGLTREEQVQLLSALKQLGALSEVDALTQQSKLLEAQYHAGKIGLAEYRAGVQQLIDTTREMVTLSEDNIKSADQLTQANQRLAEQFHAGMGTDAYRVGLHRVADSLDDLIQHSGLAADAQAELRNNLSLLTVQFDANGIDIKGYHDGIQELTSKLRTLLAQTSLTKEEQIQLLSTLKQLTALTLAPLLDESKLLEAQFHSGALTAEEYSAGINRLIGEVQKLLTNTELTKDEQLALLNAMKQLREMTYAPLIQEQQLLDAQYAAGVVGVDEYNRRTAALIDTVKDLLTNTKLTKEETIKLLAILSQLQNVSLSKRLSDEFLNVKRIADSTNEAIAAMVVGFRDDMTKAITTAFEAHKNFGETLKKEVGKAAAHYAILSVGRAIMETAEGIATVWNPKASAQHFAAAEEFMVAAAAMGAIAGATGGFSGGGSSQSAAEATNQAVSNQANGVTIIVPQGIAGSPAWIEELMNNLDQAGERRVVLRQGAS